MDITQKIELGCNTSLEEVYLKSVVYKFKTGIILSFCLIKNLD